eukprot:tig00020780_g13789.t1
MSNQPLILRLANLLATTLYFIACLGVLIKNSSWTLSLVLSHRSHALILTPAFPCIPPSLSLTAGIYLALMASTNVLAEFNIPIVFMALPFLQSLVGRGVLFLILAIPLMGTADPAGLCITASVFMLLAGAAHIAIGLKQGPTGPPTSTAQPFLAV